MYKKVSREVGGRPLTIETGRLAKQAHGAVWLQYGDTQVLVTAVSDRMREGVDFLPLTVDYQEMAYAAGKMSKFRIRVLVGDMVTLELSPYDLSRGRITYRHKTGSPPPPPSGQRRRR